MSDHSHASGTLMHALQNIYGLDIYRNTLICTNATQGAHLLTSVLASTAGSLTAYVKTVVIMSIRVSEYDNLRPRRLISAHVMTSAGVGGAS